MARKDYYDILRVEVDADQDALKRAYRDLVRTCHPDHHPDDERAAERFKDVQEAYRVLRRPEARRTYDLLRIEQIDRGSSSGSVSDTVNRRVAQGEPVTVVLSFEKALRGGHTHVQNPAGELVKVTIPRGCRDGTAVRVRGRGGNASTTPSDLIVLFKVEPHAEYRRDGNHLHRITSISAVEAMLGTTRSIVTPYGRTIHLTIPAGAQPGERIRLVGQGVATCRGVGDLFVEIDVKVPKELTEDQRAQLRQAAQSLGLL